MRELRRRMTAQAARLRIPALALALLTLAAITSGPATAPARAAGIAPAPSAAYSFGDENSWIRVQNVGSADATVTIAYFDADGRLLAGDGCPTPACPRLGPGQGWTFFQAANAALPSGYRGSAIIYTSQPLAVLEAKDVQRGAARLIDGSTTATAGSGSRLYLPLIIRADGPWLTWNSRFTVQNMSDTLACVTLTYMSRASDAEAAWDPYRPGADTVRRWGCPNGGHPIVPKGVMTRDPDTFAASAPFTGSVRIETHTNWLGVSADRQTLAANAESWNSAFNLMTSYRALTAPETSGATLLPLVERETGPGSSFSTQFQIENTNPSAPVLIRLRFEGTDFDDGSRIVRENWIGVGASRTCAQAGDGGDNCLAPGDSLPPNFGGTARLISSSPIAVVVTRGSYFSGMGAYRAPSAGEGATRVALPALNKRSWLRVFVADGGAASLRIRYIGADLAGGEMLRTINVTHEYTAFQLLDDALPNTFAGTAIIESDRPIVAITQLPVDGAAGDRDILYNGVPFR